MYQSSPIPTLPLDIDTPSHRYTAPPNTGSDLKYDQKTLEIVSGASKALRVASETVVDGGQWKLEEVDGDACFQWLARTFPRVNAIKETDLHLYNLLTPTLILTLMLPGESVEYHIYSRFWW